MKRKLLNTRFLKQTALAVPAAALMLGAAQAGTTVGLNFQAWYYDSGTTPQTIGFGQGYQTTGFPVTAKAFGVAPANWVNTEPLNCSAAVATSVALGSVTVNLTAVNPWSGEIGNLVDPATEWGQGGPLPVSWSSVLPGNDEVTWGFEDNTGWTNSLSGLSTAFPNGYVIELIGAVKCTASSRVVVTDGASTTTNAFDTIYTAGNANYPGPVGLLAIPGTNDTITFGAVTRNISSAQSCALAGLIITDQPVVVKDPPNASPNQGAAFNLSASVIGVGPLSYQWRTNGTPIPGATNAVYSNPSVTIADAGSYDVVVTNLYGATTSGVATVTVVQAPVITTDLSGVSGTIFAGANFSAWSVVAGGAQPLHYNWFKGSTPAGSDGPTLTLTNVSVADSGDYHVTVTNSLGSARSATNHLTVVASPDLYTTDVAQDSPSAYWPLGESSGTIANDYSGAAHNGTNNGGLTLGATGPRPPSYQGFNAGKLAYQFDGTSSYIDCGTGPSLSGTTDFTLEAWVKTTATAPGQIVQQRYASGYNGEYFLGLNANGTVSFTVFGGGAYQFSMTSPNSVNDGNWHYIAAVRRNGTNGVIYIDGTAAFAQNVAYIAPLDNTFITYIGADMRTPASYFNGSISDVAIYPYALSASRIGLHAYNGRLGNSAIVLSTVPGGYVLDSKPVGAAQPGVNYNTKWLASVTDTASTPVTRSGVAEFSSGAQIAIPTNADFNSPVGTICFWMLSGIPTAGTGSMLVDRRTSAGLVLFLDGVPSGGLDVQFTGGASFSAGGYVVDSNWHHVALTYDQSASGTVTVYVDGAQVGSEANTSAWSWDPNQEIELGRSHDPYWQTYNGQMDDFRIYSRVLTDTEIATIATPATSDTLVDTAALKVRYNFDTTGGGMSLAWPAGSLQSSPTLGPTAVWTPVPGAVSPYPFLPPLPVSPTGTSVFYRIGL
jgi:hypothetical protein